MTARKKKARLPWLREHREQKYQDALGLLLSGQTSTGYVTERWYKFRSVKR